MIRLLRRCHVPLLILMSFCQPPAWMLCRLAPEACVSIAFICALCMAMPALLTAMPGRLRAIAFGACCIALFGAGYGLLPHRAAMYALPAACCVVLFYALSHADKSPADISPMLYLACVLGQLCALFLTHFSDMPARVTAAADGIFCLWLTLLVLASNRISLNNATLSRYRLSAGMARTGTVLTLGTLLLTLLLCAMPAVVSGITGLARLLRDGSIWLLLFLINLFPAESTSGLSGGGMPMAPEMGMPLAGEPSRFAVILERIAAVSSMIVLIVGGAVLLRYLARALVRLMHYLLLHLQRYAAAVTEDYEDEITDTREEGSEHSFHPLRRRAKHKVLYPDTPAGHIRRRYAQLLARHSAWQASSTARENLPSSAASLYERARYSDHVPSAEDAQRFERETQ